MEVAAAIVAAVRARLVEAVVVLLVLGEAVAHARRLSDDRGERLRVEQACFVFLLKLQGRRLAARLRKAALQAATTRGSGRVDPFRREQ